MTGKSARGGASHVEDLLLRERFAEVGLGLWGSTFRQSREIKEAQLIWEEACLKNEQRDLPLPLPWLMVCG